MNYQTSARSTTKTSSVDRAIASLFVAGVMFVLGYTVVRVGMAEANSTGAVTEGADVEVVIPGEGTLWADFGTSY